MTARPGPRRDCRDRLSFGELAAMMRQPSYRRPVGPPPALHQMARKRQVAELAARADGAPSDVRPARGGPGHAGVTAGRMTRS